MVDFTTYAALAAVMSGLTPHIEEMALKYNQYMGVLAPRVTTVSDMRGWNVRKISEYKRVRRAVQLAEGTNIPDTTPIRARLAEISPTEWGDSYPISERRADTDLENILVDVVQFLGDSHNMREEKRLHAVMQAMATSSNTYSQSGNNYSLTYQKPLQAEFAKRGISDDGQLFHVIHPYQEIEVLNSLITISNGGDPVFRDAMIKSWAVGGFGNLDVVATATLPRKITYKFAVSGSAPAGTFKLRAGEYPDGTAAETGNITISATHATMLSNILAALNALSPSLGTWTGSSTALTDITVVAPHYVDAEDELRLTWNSDGDPDTSNMTTYGTVTILNILSNGAIPEKSATCRSPMFFRSALLLDIRKPFTFESKWEGKARVVENYASSTSGMAAWRSDRILFVETKATSPFAVS